ncbi:MAG: hypothetical protein LBC84_06835, partial [Prevotellaceae bacterium]|nr:hypothetical protein [Prevotellaceae bacterium]
MARKKSEYGFDNAAFRVTPEFDVNEIMRAFANKLSGSEIARMAAGAMNRACRDGITKILKPEVKKNFNVKPKDLKDFAIVSPRARSNYLAAGISIKDKPISLMSFAPTQTDAGVSVQIRKGTTTTILGSFLATRGGGVNDIMSDRYKGGKRKGQIRITGDTHVFRRGYYADRGKGFVDTKDRGAPGKSPLTRLHTIS